MENTGADVEFIDLDGPQGNAYYLMGVAQAKMRAQGDSTDNINTFLERMRSGDYYNLVRLFYKKFDGHIVFVSGDEKIKEIFKS